jgi:hypothetical protein
MSVRHETKFCWALKDDSTVFIRKTENDLAEDAFMTHAHDDPKCIMCGSEGTSSIAESVSGRRREQQDNGTLLVDPENKEYALN